ncbi:MAG: hypothetical protein ABIS21_00820, partial [Acidimicrobiales bacterium]
MLTTDIDEVIDRYRPAMADGNTAWADVAPAVREWVRAVGPTHRRRALHLLYAASSIALWCVGESIPVSAATALRDSTVERFCAAAERSERFSATTRSTMRSRLRAIAAAQRVPGNAPASPAVSRRRVRDPY